MPRISSLRLFVCSFGALTACHKGGGGSAPPQQGLFVTWANSASADVVVDYTQDELRFFADSRTLLFRGIEFGNVRVDSQSRVWWADEVIGDVCYIMSSTNQVITGLVSLAGTMIDVSPISGSGYWWFDSGVAPQFASQQLLLDHATANGDLQAMVGVNWSGDGIRFEDPDPVDEVVVHGRFEYLQSAELAGEAAAGICDPAGAIYK